MPHQENGDSFEEFVRQGQVRRQEAQQTTLPAAQGEEEFGLPQVGRQPGPVYYVMSALANALLVGGGFAEYARARKFKESPLTGLSAVAQGIGGVAEAIEAPKQLATKARYERKLEILKLKHQQAGLAAQMFSAAPEQVDVAMVNRTLGAPIAKPPGIIERLKGLGAIMPYLDEPTRNVLLKEVSYASGKPVDLKAAHLPEDMDELDKILVNHYLDSYEDLRDIPNENARKQHMEDLGQALQETYNISGNALAKFGSLQASVANKVEDSEIDLVRDTLEEIDKVSKVMGVPLQDAIDSMSITNPKVFYMVNSKFHNDKDEAQLLNSVISTAVEDERKLVGPMGVLSFDRMSDNIAMRLKFIDEFKGLVKNSVRSNEKAKERYEEAKKEVRALALERNVEFPNMTATEILEDIYKERPDLRAILRGE